MTEQRAFPKTLSLGGQTSKYEGPKQGADVLDWGGPSRATIVAISKGFGSKHPHHPQFEMTVVLKDDPAIQLAAEFLGGGAKLSGRKAIAGRDKKNEDLSRNLSDLMASATLYTVDQLEQIRLAQKAGQMEEWDPDVVIANLIGRDCIVDVEPTWDEDGRPWSNIGNFLIEAQYVDASKNLALFRQKRPAQAPAGRVGGATVGGGAGMMMGVPPPMGGAGARGALGPNPPPMQQQPQFVQPQQQGAPPTFQQPQFVQPNQMQQQQFVQPQQQQMQPPQTPNGAQPQGGVPPNVLGLANMGAVPPRFQQ